MRQLEYSTKDDKKVFAVDLKPSKYGEKRAKVNGQLFLSAEYEGRDPKLFFPEWTMALYNASRDNSEIIDRFEHFNDLLSNEFADDCQFGTLQVELRGVSIPPRMVTAEGSSKGSENKVFMLKVRAAGESKSIFVGTPDQIYGDQLESIQLMSTVESIRDTVHVEFYDVIQEDNFDPRKRQPLENLRLLSYRTFEVKDLPFDRKNEVAEYKVLMPIDFCKKVACFTFTCKFDRLVPAENVEKPLMRPSE